jgi:uncharacterized lipoprotein YmbA
VAAAAVHSNVKVSRFDGRFLENAEEAVKRWTLKHISQ